MPDYSESFKQAFDYAIGFDGRYYSDPRDPDSEANWGITRKAYPDRNIKELTRDDALNIYWNDWWIKYGFDSINNEDVGRKLFDFSVNLGIKRATILLQRSLNRVWGFGIIVDGLLGPETIECVNEVDVLGESSMLYIALCHYVANFYEQLNNPRYIRGWLRRSFS